LWGGGDRNHRFRGKKWAPLVYRLVLGWGLQKFWFGDVETFVVAQPYGLRYKRHRKLSIAAIPPRWHT